jgi:hypothetical protein
MKKIAAALLLLCVLVAGRAVYKVQAQTAQFIIQNADEVNTLSVTSSSTVNNLLAQVSPRIMFQHAQANRQIALTSIPSALNNLLAEMTPRIMFQHAQANRHLDLTRVPGQLNTLLAQMLPRHIIQHAQANRFLALGYPRTLIGDTTPPQITQIDVTIQGTQNAVVTWTTNEFADSTVRCGTGPGNYTMTFSDPLYVKQHAVTLTGLVTGTTYYCRARSTDLSGNTTQSPEFSFEQEQTEEMFVFLPLVLRR